MTLQQLLAARAGKVEEAKAIEALAEEESRDLTDDETTSIDSILDEADELTGQIKREEDTATRRARLSAASTVVQAPAPKTYAAPPSASNYPQITSPRNPWDAHMGGKLQAFSNDSAGRRGAYESGMWFRASLLGDQRARQWCEMNSVEIGNVAEEGSNPAGGFLVPDPMANSIIDLREQWGLARQELDFVPMSSDSMSLPKVASGTTVYAVGENAEITAADATWTQVQLNARKWGALSRVSSELMDDAIISISDWLATDFARSFAEKEDDALFNGDGTSTYHGIFGIRPKIVDGNHTTGAVDLESGDNTYAEVTNAGLAGVIAALPPSWHDGAKWYVSPQGWAVGMERLMAVAGGNTTVTLAGKTQHAYLGYPVVITQKMPTALTDLENVAMFVFGNLRAGVAAGERRGFRFALLRERYAELDQVGVIATTRWDMSVHGLGDTSTAGPIVAGIGA